MDTMKELAQPLYSDSTKPTPTKTVGRGRRGNQRTLGLAAWVVMATTLLFGCSSPTGDMDLEVGQEVLVEQGSFSFSINEFKMFPEYRVAPGDQLDVLFSIRTWEKEDLYLISLEDTVSIKFVHAAKLNELQRVRPDGKVSLPYIGDYLIAGKTTDQANKELKEKFSRVLKHPEIYVTITQYLSQIRELKKDLHTSTRGLSRLVTVRPDGFTTFPMVGDMIVANRTIPEIAQELNQRYYDISPSLYVDLFLEKHAGSLVYIIGEVQTPQAYELRKPISIIEAMTLAGGHTPGAKLESVIVMRRHEDKVVATRVNVEEMLEMGRKGRMFYLQPDDILYVPPTAISRTADLMDLLGRASMFNGWGLGWGGTIHRDPLLGPAGTRTTP